ncbi:tonB-dependent Receptor Plug domain protein [Escherichia coli 3.4880]|uniref:TonB-dependent Receptor Plug domain protein n=1 Tax=Escherichia coli 3.4880 TaxID=1051347 RepID=A0AAV3I5I2_ECOLX|nr:tonB-dependent Receptor Plug domain protein [Escherichia coli 3.4880]
MLYNIPCRIYILSTLSLCISGIVSTATATSSETKISNEETLVVTTNRSASNLWESPATIQVIDQQTLQNSTNASIADNLQDIPGVEITDNSLAGRKQIRIRGEASSRVLILIDGQEVTYQRAGDNYGVGLLIDESALERVEVVKGPYSVLYGSQAIGGIVNFITKKGGVNRPGFPGECFICELRLPDHRFRWKHNKLFLLLPEEYGPAFPAIVDCYTSPPTLVWPVPLLHGFSSSYGVLPPLCKDH